MIIVEGTDLTGKTTFCKKLVKYLNAKEMPYTYQHLSRLPDSWDYYWGYVDRFSYHTVQDRYHDSEIAYSHARGDNTPLDEVTYRLIDSWLKHKGVMTVLIETRLPLLDERFKEQGDKMYDFAVIASARTWFSTNRAKFDVVIDCNDLHKFPTKQDVDLVYRKYMEIRMKLNKIKSREEAYH